MEIRDLCITEKATRLSMWNKLPLITSNKFYLCFPVYIASMLQTNHIITSAISTVLFRQTVKKLTKQIAEEDRKQQEK